MLGLRYHRTRTKFQGPEVLKGFSNFFIQSARDSLLSGTVFFLFFKYHRCKFHKMLNSQILATENNKNFNRTEHQNHIQMLRSQIPPMVPAVAAASLFDTR